MSDRKFTPKEAALAVLKKAEELYKSSTLAKGEIKKDMGMPAPAAPMAPASAPPMGKSDPLQKMGMSEGSEGAPMEKMGMSEAPMKGHIKLAKFMGRMEHKKGQKAKEMDKGETGHEKGVHTAAGFQTNAPGKSFAGVQARSAQINQANGASGAARNDVAAAKGAHEQVLDQIHQMSKPKLGKGM